MRTAVTPAPGKARSGAVAPFYAATLAQHEKPLKPLA